MKHKWIVSILLFPILLSGCLVISFYPLYTPDDLFQNEILLGKWIDEDSAVWNFDYIQSNEEIERDSTSYILRIKEGEREEYGKSCFTVHIIKIKDYYFLDLYCENYLAGEDVTFYEMHLLPVHTFAKLTRYDDGSIKINWFSLEWLKGIIDKKKAKIKYEDNGENMLLTSKTKDLQKFVAKYADDDDAFKKGHEVGLKRIK